MNLGLWQRLRHRSFPELATGLLRLPGRAVELLKLPAPDAVKLLDRITTMERDIILPIKVAGIAMLLYSFYFKRAWIGEKELGTLEITVEATQYFLWVYIAANVLTAGLLLSMRRVPLLLVQWAVFAMSLVDGIFVSALVVVTGGYDSILYWLFLGLVVRGAVSVPRATSQILLNLTLTVCYVMAGSINISINKTLEQEYLARAASKRLPAELRGTNTLRSRIRSPDPAAQFETVTGANTGLTAVAESRGRSYTRPSEGQDESGREDLAFLYAIRESDADADAATGAAVADDGLLLRGAGIAGTSAARRGGGARIRDARRPVALSRTRGGRVHPPDQESAGHHQ